MAVEIVGVAGPSLEALHDQLVGVYRDTFSQPPYCETEHDVQGKDFTFPAGSAPYLVMGLELHE